MTEPFVLELYRRFTSGESAEQLSVELEIPLDRIEMRLRMAALYLNLRQAKKNRSRCSSAKAAKAPLLPTLSCHP
jgi:hypothetical protein